jgi:hypothetical protein
MCWIVSLNIQNLLCFTVVVMSIQNVLCLFHWCCSVNPGCVLFHCGCLVYLWIVPAKKKPPRKDTTTTVKQIKQTLDSHNSTNETSKANRKTECILFASFLLSIGMRFVCITGCVLSILSRMCWIVSLNIQNLLCFTVVVMSIQNVLCLFHWSWDIDLYLKYIYKETVHKSQSNRQNSTSGNSKAHCER